MKNSLKPTLISLTFSLINTALAEHLLLARQARKMPILGYVTGVLGVLVPCWGWALSDEERRRDTPFLAGMGIVSLAFVPFGAIIAFLHYIEAVNRAEKERAGREMLEKDQMLG